MGAQEFSQVAFGKTARDAFYTARENAAYEHGHGGYTGSLAEKSAFVEITIPPRADLKALIEAAWEVSWDESTPIVPANLTQHQNLILRLSRALEDKWGPAVCVKFGPTHQKELRATHGLKGKKGAFYLFTGIASS
jgi:hypothetical protein